MVLIIAFRYEKGFGQVSASRGTAGGLASLRPTMPLTALRFMQMEMAVCLPSRGGQALLRQTSRAKGGQAFTEPLCRPATRVNRNTFLRIIINPITSHNTSYLGGCASGPSPFKPGPPTSKIRMIFHTDSDPSVYKRMRNRFLNTREIEPGDSLTS